ncbi:MAG: arabinose-5-phosphate isomerase [Gammaproteobacteria bacterium]|nr:arabinose-5-phosphate isomerase [Gammaproteobacteria bacterium]
MSFLETAKEVFKVESEALAQLAGQLDSNYCEAIDAILGTQGRVIVCGMGKSGIIAKKISATLASTGTPSFFMHPGEAYHGDLGMVTPDDIFIALSNSGETEEVLKLVPFLSDNTNVLISITGNPQSTLATSSTIHLTAKVQREACPLQLAPTASTMVALAMGDALAVTLMKARNFLPENFARFHPGGALGRRLLMRVENEMISENLPYVGSDTGMLDLIKTMSDGGLGLCLLDEGAAGIVTDGDIRRALENHGESVFSLKARHIASYNPRHVEVGTRVEEAFALMEAEGITRLVVKDNGRVVGLFKK